MQHYTWQQAQLKSLEQRLQQGRFPHALLFTGPKGIGKAQFAHQLGRAMLCEKAAALKYCGECQNCRLIEAESHPDLKTITFEVNVKDGKTAKELKVDQIREVSESLSLTSQFGGYKVAIVFPADRMNQSAANSLLKTLEEPTQKTLLILVTDFPSRLLPTIRSRCQEIKFTMPEEQQALAWLNAGIPGCDAAALLAMGNGAPLLAYRAAEENWLSLRNELYQQLTASAQGQVSGIAMAAALNKLGAGTQLEQVVLWCVSWVSDVIKLASVDGDQLACRNQDFITSLQQLASISNVNAMYTWYDDLIRLQGLVNSSLNPQQMMEKLFSDWQDAFLN